MGADDFYGGGNCDNREAAAAAFGRRELKKLKAKGVYMPASDEVMVKVLSDPKITLLTHPVIQHKITRLRNKDANKAEVRSLVKEIAVFGFYEMTRNLPLQMIEVETPMAKMQSMELAGKKPMLVPIWRAGEPMADAILDSVMPTAREGNIGMYRNADDIKHPTCYYDKATQTNMAERDVYVLDPMLATGWSAAGAIETLKNKYGYQKIHFMCIISVWDGIEVLRTLHPDVDLYLGAVDAHLDEHNYIIPGLGDAGDRITGTK